MKTSILFLSLSLLAATACPGQTSLDWKWTPGARYSFRAVQKDKVEMGGGMLGGIGAMAGAMEFHTESSFTLRIRSVQPDGSADGLFTLTGFRVRDNRGKSLASLQNISRDALKAPFTVDAKGNFTFTEAPVLICRESGNLLVSARYKPGELAASAEIDGEKVTLFAEFNPATGSLKAGYSATTLKPGPRPVVVKPEDNTLDLIPTDFLDLLVLPEGPVSEGQSFQVSFYGTRITETVEALQPEEAKIRLDVSSSLDARKFASDAEQMAGEDDHGHDHAGHHHEDGEMDMPPGMDPDMPDMRQQNQGTMTLRFDPAAGRMKSLEGQTTTRVNMAGMEITTTSWLTLTPSAP